jgi:Helicase associated domain
MHGLIGTGPSQHQGLRTPTGTNTQMISIRRTSSSSSLCYNDHPAEDEEDEEDVDEDAPAARKAAPEVAPPAFASSLKTLPSQGSTTSSCVGSDEIDEQDRREIAESLLALSGPPPTAHQQFLIGTMATPLPPPLDLLPSVPPPPPPPPLATRNGSLQDVSNQIVPAGGGPSKTPRHASWAAKFELLYEFKKKHGHCPDERFHPELGRWVNYQRKKYKLVEAGQPGALTADCIASLNGIGFVWDQPTDARWTEKYNDLLKYKEAYGHCLVPPIYPADPDLGKWVAAQRARCRATKGGRLRRTAMTASRVKLLEDAGFFAGCTKPENILGGTIDAAEQVEPRQAVSSPSFDSIKNPLSQEVDDCQYDTALFEDLTSSPSETRPIGSPLRNHHAFKCIASSRQDEAVLDINEDEELPTKTTGNNVEGAEEAAPRPAISSSSFASFGTLPSQERDPSCVTSEEIIQERSKNVERLVAPSDQSPENESGTTLVAFSYSRPPPSATSIGARDALASISNQTRPTGSSSEYHRGRKRKATPFQDEDARQFLEPSQLSK